MKTFRTPWKAEQNERGNWSVKNASGETLVTIEYRVHRTDAANLARMIAVLPEMYAALKRVEKLDTQTVPAARFTGERRKAKFDQIEAAEAGVLWAIAKAEGRSND